MTKISYEPPSTNRGVERTTPQQNQGILETNILKEKQRICVDWCQFTIIDKFGYTPEQYFYNLFGITKKDIGFENKGLFCYSYTYSYKNIKIFVYNDTFISALQSFSFLPSRQLTLWNNLLPLCSFFPLLKNPLS